jgi:hypothetical protein
MKTSLCFLALLLLGLTPAARADDAAVIAAVRAADDARVAALIKADVASLDNLLSAQLRYAHSNGHVDTKKSYGESVATHRSVYGSVKYLEREFLPVAPGIVLMEGRVLIEAGDGTKQNLLDLNYLAVWREENGQWRFLAWQSCKNPSLAK